MAQQAVILSGQSLLDLAVERFGAWEAAVDIALLTGVSLTDTPDVDRSYSLPDKVYDRVMQAHCKSRRVSPATLYDRTGVRWRIFTPPFNLTFR